MQERRPIRFDRSPQLVSALLPTATLHATHFNSSSEPDGTAPHHPSSPPQLWNAVEVPEAVHSKHRREKSSTVSNSCCHPRKPEPFFILQSSSRRCLLCCRWWRIIARFGNLYSAQSGVVVSVRIGIIHPVHLGAGRDPAGEIVIAQLQISDLQ